MAAQERKRRVEKIQLEAADLVRKSGQLNFRLEPELIGKLGDLAIEKRIPLGAMVRNWVLERFEQEQAIGSSSAVGAVAKKRSTAISDMGDVFKRMQSLESEFKQQRSMLSEIQKELKSLRPGKRQRKA